MATRLPGGAVVAVGGVPPDPKRRKLGPGLGAGAGAGGGRGRGLRSPDERGGGGATRGSPAATPVRPRTVKIACS